jgi:S-adenosylmethionine:tRNA ribosyltransferase-isomerase
MSTPIELFTYVLPPERIAQVPMEPRDHSRLLLLNRKTGKRKHVRFDAIVKEFKAGDVLVMNNTKVFKARLHGEVIMRWGHHPPRKIEVFLLRGHDSVLGSSWEVLLRPAKKVEIEDTIDFGGITATLMSKDEKEGTAMLHFDALMEEVLAFTDAYGEVPLPPYIGASRVTSATGVSGVGIEQQYQTVYAQHVGSVAAPTAGFHFTPELLEQIKEKGVQIECVTLHVGIGTFRPVKTETLEEHVMHREWIEIPKETAERINAAKKEKRRVIAVGTTTTRALEGAAAESEGVLPEGFSGDVNIFITPGFKFRVIDGLITNFHLPKSTLLVLVSTFAGREHVLAAYEEAVEKEYRFYSFGDAMFIV